MNIDENTMRSSEAGRPATVRVKRKYVGSAALIVIGVALFWYLAASPVGLLPAASAATGTYGVYTTAFPLTENPISEGGNWKNGGTNGVSWTNVRTTPGLAFGTMPGNASGGAQYADSTAILSGTWGPNQTVQATVYTVNQPTSGTVFEEVELRLRTTITANSITGYEINFSCSAQNLYAQIVRWNGPLASWTQLNGATYHVVNGDVVKATIVGSTITVYLNNVQIETATDSTFTGGSPGMGFFLQGATGVNGDYGFTNFTASDGSPAPPTGLSATVK